MSLERPNRALFHLTLLVLADPSGHVVELKAYCDMAAVLGMLERPA